MVRLVAQREDPSGHVLVEAFRDTAAGADHVRSEHFVRATQTLPVHLVDRPRVVNATLDQEDWSGLGEMAVPG